MEDLGVTDTGTGRTDEVTSSAIDRFHCRLEAGRGHCPCWSRPSTGCASPRRR